MRASVRRLCFLVGMGLVVGMPLRAHAQDTVRREWVDAGVHVPVLTKPPALEHFVAAEYPKDAEAAGKSGQVTLTVTIAPDGTVSEAKVAEPAGDGFDDAAVAAVRQFAFTPAEIDGVKAAVQIQYVYHFELKPKPPPEVIKPVAPKATLQGVLYGRGRRVTVPAATVRCGDDPDAPEARSDAKGHFTLPTTPGNCAVRVVANGFDIFRAVETLTPNETLEVKYYLTPRLGAYETVVKGDRDVKEVVKRTFSREEAEKIPGTFGDPIRVIQNLPGVARAPFGLGQLIVRGAAPNETLTFLDGVEIPILFHLGGGPSVVNAQFLDKVDFFPGGFGARYGRAIGGVVDVTTHKGAVDAFHGEAKIDVLDSSLFAEVPISKDVSLAAAGRRSYVDALLPFVLPKNPEGGTLLILPAYWDYQARIDIGHTRKTGAGIKSSTFYVMAFGSDDTLKVVATGGGRNRDLTVSVQTLFHRLKGDWTFKEGNVTSVFSPYLGYDLANGNFGTLAFRADRYNGGGREDLTLELTRWMTARAGFDLKFEHIAGKATLPVLAGLQYVEFPGAQPVTEPQTLALYPNTFDGAVFLETDLKLGPLTVTPGLRASYQRVYGQDRKAFDPRLWLRYVITPRTEVKGSVGLYSQAPASTNMAPAPLGNPHLGDEHAFQTSLGVLQKLTDSLNIDVTGFFNRRYALVANTPANVVDIPFNNGGLGRAYGLEVLLRQEVTERLFGWVAYTLNRSEIKNPGDTAYHLASFDETHILTVVGSYKLPWSFEAGVRFRYVTGRPYTPILHPYDQTNIDANNYSGVPGAAGSARYDAFNQLDLRLERDFLFKTWTLAVYLDVQNVYNQVNQEALLYDYRYRSSVQVPGVPILPDLGFRGSW